MNQKQSLPLQFLVMKWLGKANKSLYYQSAANDSATRLEVCVH